MIGGMTAAVNVRDRTPLCLAGLVALTLLAYLPALGGGFIWDDPDYVVNRPQLRTLEGLRQIWFEPRSLPQYYPMVFTTFWLEHQAFGLTPAAFKLTNVALHAGSALLLWSILRRLNVPGALLAAAVFALHPVQVESVAWITERKNTLSMLFALAALRVYLPALDARPISGARYAATLTLFMLALLSKTTACALPAAMLVMIWWRLPRVGWRDVAPLAPMLVVGAFLALQTAALEREHVGAVGREWDYAATAAGEFVHRTLIAGRAVCFYVGKLLLPIDLAFIYPRWEIDRGAAAQYAYPAAVAAGLLALWLLRRRIGRGPFAAAVIYVGALLPALGYFNVFPHRYSFVADHFQYLATPAALALLGAALATAARRARRARFLAAAAVVGLAVLTFRQGFIYRDAETLWRDTVRKNPASWMAWTNLGNALAAERRYDEAIPYFERAYAVSDAVEDTHYNIGVARVRQGRPDDAERHFRRALEINPAFVPAMESLGKLELLERRNPSAAEPHFRAALAIAPRHAPALLGLAETLEATGHVEEAARHYDLARQAKAGWALPDEKLAALLLRGQRYDEAAAPLRRLAEMRPGDVEAWSNLGWAELLAGRRPSAIAAFDAALALDPNHAQAARGRSAAAEPAP